MSGNSGPIINGYEVSSNDSLQHTHVISELSNFVYAESGNLPITFNAAGFGVAGDGPIKLERVANSIQSIVMINYPYKYKITEVSPGHTFPHIRGMKIWDILKDLDDFFLVDEGDFPHHINTIFGDYQKEQWPMHSVLLKDETIFKTLKMM
jgi:hypothetical protein